MKVRDHFTFVILCGALATGILVAPFFDRPSEVQSDYAPPVINVEINGVCGTLVGAGASLASFIHEAKWAARGGYVGAAIAAGCLLKDVGEYRLKDPAQIAYYDDLQRRFSEFHTYEALMTRGMGCVRVAHRPINRDDVDGETTYSWDCSKGPYAGYD